MPGFIAKWLGRPAPGRCRSVPLLMVLACLPLGACKDQAERQSSVQKTNPLARQLAGARVDAAKAALEKSEPGHALHLLVSALEADPESSEALRLIRPLLAETRWTFPHSQLDAGMPVEKLAVSGKSLWSGLSDPDGWNTTVRWNLGTLAVESVLFPRRGETTRRLALSPDASRIVVTRGTEDHSTTLLCDAVSLKPVRTLADGPRRDEALLTFAPDRPLVAHDTVTGEGIVWHIRDLATGEIVRSFPLEGQVAAVAAVFNGPALEVHLANRSMIRIPVSPVEEPVVSEFAEPPARDPSPDEIFAIHGTRIETTRELPLPKTTGRDTAPLQFEPRHLLSLRHLAEAVTGLSFDQETRGFTPLTEAERRSAIGYCHQPSELLSGLDFTPVVSAIKGNPFVVSPASATLRLRDRIERTGTRATADVRKAAGDVFLENEPDQIVAALGKFQTGGPLAAEAFRFALESRQPSWIRACLTSAHDIPPLLNRFALSRVAWLEDRRPDAIAAWRNGFPDHAAALRTEDWNGWEVADFAPAFESHFAEIRAALASFEVPDDPEPESLRSVSERLLDASTTRAIGKRKHAEACLNAAKSSSTVPEEIGNCLKLLTLARVLGAPPAECLRVEAVAHMTAGDFFKAHECWISLISDFPVETHQPRDYTEAAYTAFENGNGEQAMAILGTGVIRFPHNVDFAYRAGWISLLTGRSAEAFEFLMVGERIGYPEDKIEKATAMLVIAASQSGAVDDAGIFFSHLKEIDPAWAEPDPPKTEGWPPELKAALLSVGQPPKAVPVPESIDDLLGLPE